MPSKGFRSISLDEEILKHAQEILEHWNDVVGWKGYRSLAHFVESAIVYFIDNVDRFLEKEAQIKRSPAKQ